MSRPFGERILSLTAFVRRGSRRSAVPNDSGVIHPGAPGNASATSDLQISWASVLNTLGPLRPSDGLTSSRVQSGMPILDLCQFDDVGVELAERKTIWRRLTGSGMSLDGKRSVLILIGLALLVRASLCQMGDLGVDESYTIVQSRQLQLSYFDHPPLHYWMTHAAVALFGEGRLARLPFILLFSGTGWLLFRLTDHLYGRRAAFWAVAGSSLAPFFTLSAGSWIVPDGPLLFGLALAADAAARVLLPAPETRATPWRSWLLVGLGFGIAALSKYHAILIAAGLLGLLLTPSYRRYLRHPAPWIGGVLALALASPVLAWNVEHGWASLSFQIGRGVPSGVFPFHLAASAAGQLGLLAPWLGAVLVLTMVSKRRAGSSSSADRFCLALGLPTILLFALASLFGHLTLPHWSMPGWFLLMPVAGRYFAILSERRATAAPCAVAAACASLLLLLLAGAQTATGCFTDLLPSGGAKKDPTLEAFRWDGLDAAVRSAGQAGAGMIVTDGWISAGKLDLAFKGRLPVVPASADPRGFAFTLRQRDLLGSDAVVIVPKAKVEATHGLVDSHFAAIGPEKMVALHRGLGPEVDFVLYRASHFLTPFQWPYGSDR